MLGANLIRKRHTQKFGALESAEKQKSKFPAAFVSSYVDLGVTFEYYTTTTAGPGH